jgi:hypothetical protein
MVEHTVASFRIAVAAVMVVALVFILAEPIVSRSASATDIFTITQNIGEEISFLVAAADVTMTGTLGGLVGGNATGTTFAVVRTNSSGGYVMDIRFDNNPAMLGSSTGSTAIRDYGTTTEPSFNFVASTSAQFGYTVSASTTADLDPSFRDNGTACNTGASDASNRCWKGPQPTDFRIISRSTSAAFGATTTIQFVVNVPNNPIPAVEEDFYIATATLTAITQ